MIQYLFYYLKFSKITFYGNLDTDFIELEFKFFNRYYLLSESILKQKKSDKNDLPSLPKDIVLSIINNSE